MKLLENELSNIESIFDKKIDKYTPNKAKIDLHIHAYLDRYPFEKLIKTAEKKELNIVGLIHYQEDLFPLLHKEAKKLPKERYEIRADNGTCIVVYNKETKNKTYFLKAHEIMTSCRKGKENFQIIGIGDLPSEYLKKEDPFPRTEECIDELIKNDGIAIIDHAFANATDIIKPITKEKEKDLIRLCKRYREEVALEWNSYCKPILRGMLNIPNKIFNRELTRCNANKSAEELSERLKDYNIRIIADSDVHARDESLLNAIGSGHIEIFKERMNYSSGKNILKSIKNSIKVGEGYGYKNIKNYVSSLHLFRAIALPKILNLERVRG